MVCNPSCLSPTQNKQSSCIHTSGMHALSPKWTAPSPYARSSQPGKSLLMGLAGAGEAGDLWFQDWPVVHREPPCNTSPERTTRPIQSRTCAQRLIAWGGRTQPQQCTFRTCWRTAPADTPTAGLALGGLREPGATGQRPSCVLCPGAEPLAEDGAALADNLWSCTIRAIDLSLSMFITMLAHQGSWVGLGARSSQSPCPGDSLV